MKHNTRKKDTAMSRYQIQQVVEQILASQDGMQGKPGDAGIDGKLGATGAQGASGSTPQCAFKDSCAIIVYRFDAMEKKLDEALVAISEGNKKFATVDVDSETLKELSKFTQDFYKKIFVSNGEKCHSERLGDVEKSTKQILEEITKQRAEITAALAVKTEVDRLSAEHKN